MTNNKPSPHTKYLMSASVVLALLSVGLVSFSLSSPELAQRKNANRQAAEALSQPEMIASQQTDERKEPALDADQPTDARISWLEHRNHSPLIQGDDFVEYGIRRMKEMQSRADSKGTMWSEPNEPYISVYDSNGKFSYGIYLLDTKNKARQSLAMNGN